MTAKYQFNHDAAEALEAKLQAGGDITLTDIGDVIGQPFWELIVMLLLDSQDAARAIQGAISRLRAGEDEDKGLTTWESDDDEDDDIDD